MQLQKPDKPFSLEEYQRKLLAPYHRNPFPPTGNKCRCGKPSYFGAFGRHYCFACGRIDRRGIALKDIGHYQEDID